MDRFTITFYGVCGSSTARMPGRERYGGNTSCALVRAGDSFIVLDMGTGFAVLSRDIARLGLCRAAVLLSHYHYDHIEGFPHFGGFYQPLEVDIYGQSSCGKDVRQLLYGYLSQPYYPITPDSFLANIAYHTIQPGDSFDLGEVRVETYSTNHPGGALAYKLHYRGKTLVHLLDHELGSALDAELLGVCRGADLLVMDAQFTEEEYGTGTYTGWGHSTHWGCVEFAKAAGARTVALTHHAIQRRDQELDAIALEMQDQPLRVEIAFEGMELEV